MVLSGMPVYPLVQGKNAAAPLAGLKLLKSFLIDLHPAVNQVNIGQQFTLGTHGLDSRTVLRLPVVGEHHMLEQNCLLLGDIQCAADLCNFLGPHHKMAQELTLI